MKIQGRETEKIYQRFQAIVDLLFVLGGLLDTLKKSETAAECAWKHLQKKYGAQTTEELVAEIEREADDYMEVDSDTEKNLAHFVKAGIAVARTQRGLAGIFKSSRRDSIVAAVKKLRLEHNQILRELQRRGIAQVANKKMLEI